MPEEEYEYTSVRDRKKQFVESPQHAPRKFYFSALYIPGMSTKLAVFNCKRLVGFYM